MDKEELIKVVINAFIALAVIFSLLGFSIEILTKLFSWLLLSLFISLIVERLLENLELDFLEDYEFELKIFGYEFSLTWFFIVAVTLKIIIF